MFPMISYSYFCLPYEIPYEKATVPNNDFFQLLRMVLNKASTLVIVLFKVLKLFQNSDNIL